jgi:hypothetical protein
VPWLEDRYAAVKPNGARYSASLFNNSSDPDLRNGEVLHEELAAIYVDTAVIKGFT